MQKTKAEIEILGLLTSYLQEVDSLKCMFGHPRATTFCDLVVVVKFRSFLMPG